MKMILAIIQFQIFRFPYIGKWAVLFSLLAISLEGMAQYRINLSVDQTHVEIGDTLQFSISLQTDAQQAAAYGTRFLLNIGTSNIGYLSDDSVKYMGLFGESSVAFTQYSQQKHEIDLAASATEGTGITNSGTIFTLFLVALDTGNVTLTVKDLELRDIDGNLLNSVSDSLALYIHNIAPLAPTNFTATADTQKVTLQWMANTEEDLAEYRIYYRQNDTLDYQQLSVVMVTESAHPTEFVHSGLEEKQPFSYWMQALDGDGNISDSSLVLRATVPDVTPPAKPQGFTGEATIGQVKLSWLPNAETDVLSYEIFYRDSDTTNYAVLVTLSVTQDSIPIEYVHSGLSERQVLSYRMQVIDDSGNRSDSSDVVAVKIPDVTAPLAPTNFTATADTQKVTLQWMANTEEDLAEYRIYYRQNDTLDYQQLSVVMVTEAAHPTEFVHSGLEEKQTFSYWMQALDGDGNVSDSSLILRATVPDVTPPAKPQGFTGAATESLVSLVWQKNSEPDLAYYTIFRGVNSSTLDSLTSIQGNAQPDSSFTDTLVVSGTIYEYVIKAVDSSNNKSLQSDTLRIMTFLSQIDLVAPENGLNEVNTAPNFSWITPNGAQFYDIQIATDGEFINDVLLFENLDAPSYTSEVSLKYLTQYFWRVRGADSLLRKGPWSEVWNFKTKDFNETDGLVAYYRFNGNAADSSGNGNDGVVNGASLTSDRFGNANGAMSFDGVDDWVQVADNQLFKTNTFSISLWFKWNDFGSNSVQFLTAKGIENFELHFGGGAGLNGLRFIPADQESDYFNYVGTNNWIHLVANYDAGVANIYRDGTLIAQNTTLNNRDLTTDNSPFFIGKRSDTSDAFFHGSLDDIRIYNRALSADEVLALYHQESAPQTPTGLLAEAGDNEVILRWRPNTEPDCASYQLFRGTERENLSLVTTLESISDTVYTDSEVTNRIPYFYAIRAVDNDGYSSAFSDTLEVTPTSPFDVGLVAYYPFNGNAVDSSGNGNDGTVNGATLTTDRFGNANRAYAFDGVDDWISIAHNSSFDFSTKALSVGVIARIPFSSAEEYILSQGLELPFTLGIREGKYWLKMGNETENVSLSSQSAPENEYDYLFGTYDGSEVRLYVNGILEANTPFSADLMASSDSLHIGSRSSDNQWHIEGIMDDVRIYNRAITPQEVLDLYYVEMAPSTPNNISIAPGNGLVKLQWDANPEPDVSQYLIYIEGSDEFFSVADTAAIVGGLINGTSYTFTITALDESMNESAYSNSVTATPFDLNQGLTQDLRSYWSFDATNGAAVVDEVGTLDVTPTFENGIVSDGKLASFLQITGQSGDANAFPTYVQAVNEAFSHSFWFRTQNLEVSDLVWGQYATSAANINAFIGIENGQFFWTQRNSTWSTPEPFGANLSSDRWYFLTAAMDENGSFSIYVDAQEVFSGSLTGSSNTAATPLGLRGNFDFDEFAVYSRVLTHNEILALYNNGQGLGYPFDDSDSDVFAPHEPVFASIISAQSSLTLSWLANQDSDVAFYSIYRGTHRNQLDSLTAIFVGSAPDTAFVDTNIIADTTYFYSITATDLAGNQSSFSDTLAAKTTDQTPPNPVQNLGAQAGDKSVLLSWNPNTEPDLAYYALFRGTQRTSLDSLTSIMRGSAPDTAFSDTTVVYESTYHYAIAAVDEAGNVSVMSDTISAKPLDLRPPLPPSAFVVNGFHRQARLFWSPSASADVAEYRLLRQVGNNPSFSDLSQVAAPDTNFIDNGINNGQTVTYRLFAVNQNGVSSDTLEASAQPRPPVLATRSKTKRVVPAHRNVITGEGFGDSSEGSSILITEVVNKESGASVLPNPQRETDFERADEALEIESTTTARKTAEITSSTQATIISWNDSTIVFSVPEDVTPGEKTVSLDLRGEEIIQNFSFTVLPTVTVWPGDTNNDGKVSAADLMRIAIYFGESETFDPLVDVSWRQSKRPAWEKDGGQPRRAFADANADSVIDQNDLAALTVNYGNTVGSGSKSIASDLQNAQQALTDTLHLVGHISHNQGRLLFEFRLENEEIPDILGMAFALELPDITTQTKAAWRTHRDAQGVQLELALPRMESGRVHASVGGESVTHLSRYGALGLLEITSPAVHPEKLSFHDLRVWNLSGRYYPTILRLEEVMATSNEWESQLPQELSLSQNYPNPFNPSTTIRFGLPDAGTIVLEVFSLTGQRIGVYAQGAYNAGFHQVTINASNWASGVYFYRLRTENKVITKKMVLVK